LYFEALKSSILDINLAFALIYYFVSFLL